jgi:SNF2 family DNA or RNA helicase
MIYEPRKCQQFTTDWIVEKSHCGPFVDMGLGKTAATLDAINRLYKAGEIRKVLVIAPKKVAENVWRQEGQKWECFRHLTFSMILGSEAQRKKALAEKAHIYVVSRDNIAWLISQFGTAFPFDMLVIDESSSFKNVKSGRFKALRMILPKVKRAVILTGTPTPNGLLQLWPQIYILDRGARLGTKFTEYRRKYFTPSAMHGNMVVKYELKGKKGYDKKLADLLGEDLARQEIHEKISDICYSMKSEDYIDLPPFVNVDVPIILPADIMQKYYEFERDQVLAISDEVNLTAVNAAGLSNKLLQFANGAVYYDQEKKLYHEVHNAKLEALEDLLDASNGQSVLVFYWFQHDMERILKHLKAYQPRLLKKPNDFESWNAGQIQLGLLHPQSGGHGLNLQAGGSISAWFSNTWDLELDQQSNKRLHRPGQDNPVVNHRFVTRGTMDEQVLSAIAYKAQAQNSLLEAVKAPDMMSAVKDLIRKYKS